MKVSKPLAPYGKYLANQVQHKSNLDVAIIFMGGFGRERARDFQDLLPYTMYLPARSSPFNFFWPINNCEVYLVDTDNSQPSFIRFCVMCFFGYGAKYVRYISGYKSFTFEKGISHG